MDLWQEPVFRAVVDSLEDCIFTLNPAGLITGFHCNNGSLLPFSEQHALGKPLETVVPTELSCTFKTAIHSLQMTGLPQTLNYHTEQQGRRRHFNARLMRLVVNNEDHGCLVMIGDVTGQAMARQVSQQHESIYQLLAENSTDVIAVESPQGQVLFISPSIVQLAGYRPEEIIGQSRKTFVHPDDFKQIWLALPQQKLCPPPEGMLLKYRIRHKRDDWIWVETKMQTIEWKGREAVLSNTRDIAMSERADQRVVSMLKEVEIARQKAEAANQAKSEFLTSISHDLRTPLHGLLGMAELLAQTHLTQEQQEYLSAIQESGDTLLARLNDLLDLSKIESGQLDLQQVDFDIVETVEGLLDIMGRQATSKGILLFCHVHSEVPPVVRGDPHRLRQVLINLISNAIKFTNEGEVDVRVTAQKRGKIRFSVRDTGVGISSTNIDHIMGKTEPVHTTQLRFAKKTPKMGIGLRIAKQLVALLGGELKVKSKEERGSTFYFDLALPASKRKYTEFQGNELAGKRVLAADENATNRQLIREKLELSGAEVDLASGGVETIRTLLDDPTYHCVILSANLPDLDGFSTAAMIRSNRTLEEMPLVMIISSAEPDEIQRCKELKVNATLAHPVSRDVLVRAVQEVVTSGEFNGLPVSQETDSTILIVEDNEMNLKLAQDILQRAGYGVVSAKTGSEALKQMEQHHIDVVLMDIQLPDMDGIEVTQKIRSTPAWATLPIIAMTAYAMKGDAEEFVQAGVDNCLTKPVNQMELLEVLRQELTKRQKSQRADLNASTQS